MTIGQTRKDKNSIQKNQKKRTGKCENRTHDLEIMRLTR